MEGNQSRRNIPKFLHSTSIDETPDEFEFEFEVEVEFEFEFDVSNFFYLDRHW